ncbi:MAG: amidohydrolase [Chloroflexia bacterium]|nr:amidohydrolase [Chloroflexia bacterium]
MRFLIILVIILNVELMTTIVIAQKAENEVEKIIDVDYPTYYKLYTYLHQNPELSFLEKTPLKNGC